MAKPIRFELEFSGWSSVTVDSDDAVRRPATADEIATAIAADLNHKLQELHGRSKGLRVTVKRLT